MSYPNTSERSSLKKMMEILFPLLIIFGIFGLAFLGVQRMMVKTPLKNESSLAFETQMIQYKPISIALVMDLSSSMLAQDFKPNRLDVCKEVLIDFVNRQSVDSIGLVVFAEESKVVSSMTTDSKIIADFLISLKCGVLPDGTAIGLGLEDGISLLKESNSKRRVLILITDGENNSGDIQPLDATEIAKQFNIEIYTIGITGTDEDVFAPVGRYVSGEYVFGHVKNTFNADTLIDIATITNGQYFRATNKASFQRIFEEIDSLETVKSEIVQ